MKNKNKDFHSGTSRKNTGMQVLGGCSAKETKRMEMCDKILEIMGKIETVADLQRIYRFAIYVYVYAQTE